MIPQLVGTYCYPLSGLPIRLFRNPETREGIVLGCEIADLMEYASMSFLRRSGECLENIHFFVLRKERLKKFKHHLESKNIRIYLHSRRLLLLTETGVAFLLGKYCKEKAMRAGEWLVSHALPHLRPQQGVHCLKISSNYLNREFFIFRRQGRFALSASQIFSLLGLPSLDQLSKAINAYIPNIHLGKLGDMPRCDSFPKSFANCIFYESGLYRYWNHVHHPLVPLMKKAFEKEIWPQFRRDTRSASSLSSVEKYPGQPENTQAMEGVVHWNTGGRISQLEDLQKMLKQLQLSTDKGFGVLQQKLLDELSQHRRILQDFIDRERTSKESVFLGRTKELARYLGFYYLDRITPHIVFTRALIDYARSSEKEKLQLIVETKLQMHPGENTVMLLHRTYRVWKSP